MAPPEQFHVQKEEEMAEVAAALHNKIKEGKRIIFFTGEPGAGKTTLIRYILKVMKKPDLVQSPTFNIIHEYDKGNIVHVDLYRLKKEDELVELGFFEYVDREVIILIEWPEILQPFIKPDVHVQIVYELPDNRRIITIK